MKKSFEKIIIVTIVIIFILIAAIVVILMSININEQNKYDLANEQYESYSYGIENPASILNGQTPKIVDYDNTYNRNISLFNKYLEYVEEKNSEALIDIVDIEYLNENNISETNILNSEVAVTKNVEIIEMYELNGIEYYSYYMKGNSGNSELYYNLNYDFKNNTYSIKPLSKSKYEEILNTTIEGKSGKEAVIEQNKYNSADLAISKKDVTHNNLINGKIVTNINDFHIIMKAVNKYYAYIDEIATLYSEKSNISQENIEKIESIIYKNIFNLLDEKYIEYADITESNIKAKLEKEDNILINISEMYVIEKNENMETYLIYFDEIYVNESKVIKTKMMINLDKKSNTFSILLEDYIDDRYVDLNDNTIIVSNIPDTIVKKEVNVYTYRNISDEEHILYLFNNLKQNLMYNREAVYNNLQEEYSNKKFESYDDFELYAKNNSRKTVTMELDKYEKVIKDGYVQYMCQDTNGNYYIFNEYNMVENYIILDIYTIDIPEYVNIYNQLDDNEKAMFNVNKIITAINEQDYNYVYSKLDETFRENNFKSVEELKYYIENKFYKNMEIIDSTYEKIGEYYSVKVKIKNAENSSDEEISQEFIIKLLEGTDFVFSFNIN